MPAETLDIEALRQGDEAAFRRLVERHHASLVRVARTFVHSGAIADEVAQDTWLAVLTGLDRFDGRSSLRTWMFQILGNIARARGVREARSVPMNPMSSGNPVGSDGWTSVDPSWFETAGHPEARHWREIPADWSALPDETVLAVETLDVIAQAIDRLPVAQRQVITLRDVEGWTAAEVCDVLGLSEGNERVLLHRARTKVRTAVAGHLGRS